MEPENNNFEITEDSKSSLHKVTPLSKYLAMGLFIAMPFIGGWIGYMYAPEKVVEVERVVLQDKDNLDQKAFNLKPAFVTNIGEGASNYPDNNYLLGDFSSKTIYKYNPELSVYEVLVEDVRNLRNFSEMNIFGLTSLEIYGWSDDLRYIGIRVAPYEGVLRSQLYYIDTQDMESGFRTVNFITTNIDDMVSPDGTKVLGFEATFVSTKIVEFEKGSDRTYPVFEVKENELKMFDLNNLGKFGGVRIYGPVDDNYTFMTPSFYGEDYINGKWIDNETVELKLSTVENYKMLAGGPYDENHERFEEALEVITLKVE